MELIPILSTIILVATISTFLLAIGAYILYKVREGKETAAVASQPQEVSAELVTPDESRGTRPAKPGRYVPQPEFAGGQPVRSIPKQPFMYERASGTAPSQPGFTPEPRPYQAYRQQPKTAPQERKVTAPAGSVKNAQKEKSAADSRFLKYTSEGYIPAKEDKDAGALKWR